MRGVAGEALLAQLTTLNAGAAQHLAVLLLGHALAALLDDRTHSRFPHFRYQYVRNPAGNAWNKTTRGALEAAPAQQGDAGMPVPKRMFTILPSGLPSTKTKGSAHRRGPRGVRSGGRCQKR